MLKLIYTETSFYLEYVVQSLEEWVAQQAILALRVGQVLCVKPSTASFLLPVNLSGVEVLRVLAYQDDQEIIALDVCDLDFVEVTLRGSWLSNGAVDADGLFVTAVSDRTELFLHKLWLEAQACTSVCSE
ncbi:hypothetical protein G7B40_036230 [Aetokthonos hydrillicola Thurmond2011]|jgi:hypothetical protein|uniref:Uncharacterized protein n=1 Tax=Aetokthonos hydrillicola Thurmond2011 TaxID=2712845 RepID=A0AAP5IFV0_9CYAN|nr:alr0857 family protein [Aetokthonos hydrillicola]MBO3457906.1 hypothetical protein [Aetokthonos hydrillicola CCALA 1050]MBW4587393.1 hypothetical protein [Aetokthonos hydrillicola CCALA 1050]MDR9899962.1 hypothetical protein [Aetokthonos hydrillicola Thurmond2011]